MKIVKRLKLGIFLALAGTLLAQGVEGKDKLKLSTEDQLRLKLVASEQAQAQTLFNQLNIEGQRLSEKFKASQDEANRVRERVCKDAKVPLDECTIPPDYSAIVRVAKKPEAGPVVNVTPGGVPAPAKPEEKK